MRSDAVRDVCEAYTHAPSNTWDYNRFYNGYILDAFQLHTSKVIKVNHQYSYDFFILFEYTFETTVGCSDEELDKYLAYTNTLRIWNVLSLSSKPTIFRHLTKGTTSMSSEIRSITMPMNNIACLKLLPAAHTPCDKKECGAVGMESNGIKQVMPTEKMLRFLEENDPYHFQVDDTAVTVSFGGEVPFQDALVNALNAS